MSDSTKPVLIIDVDDVLLDWTASFDLFIRKNCGYDGIPLGENPSRLWDIMKTTKAEVIAVMKLHNQSPEFINLKSFKDADVINDYKDLFSEVYSITSCGIELEVQNARKENLELLFPGLINNLICLDYFEQKYAHIERICIKYDNVIMLDDNVNDIKFIETLQKGVVYKSKFYNSDGMHTVNSMKEFCNNVKKGKYK